MDMKTISKSVEIDLPVTTVYNQWTQFEEFPQFMEGVNKVVQTDDTHLHWETEIGMVEREFDAEITEQTPDQVIAWRALGDTMHVGRVTFDALGASKTRVNVEMAHAPENFVEKAGDMLGIVGHRIEGDLKNFKKMIEERGTATGGFRGDVEPGGSTNLK